MSIHMGLNARMRRTSHGWQMLHGGGRDGRLATDALLKAVPRLAEQINWLTEGFDLFVRDEEINTEVIATLEKAGVDIRAMKAKHQ